MFKTKTHNLISYKENPYQQVEKICLFANKLRKIIYKKTGINSNLVFYEFIFFFYTINDTFLKLTNTPEVVINKIAPLLFNSLEKTNNPEYKIEVQNIKIIAFFRIKAYRSILLQYSEKITTSFYQDSYQFLADLIAYIHIHKEIASKDYAPVTKQEWIEMALLEPLLQKINRILVKKHDVVLDFLFK